MATNLNKVTRDFDGVPLRHCMIDYMGQTNTMWLQLYDDTPLPKSKKIQCKFRDRKTKVRCITLLNAESIRMGDRLCDLHRNCHLWDDKAIRRFEDEQK